MSIQRNIFLERAGLLKTNEEVDQLDELSKGTLGSYVGKAYKDQGERMAKTGVLVGLHSAEHGKAPTIKQTKKIIGKDEVRKDKNRDAGMDRAVSRLSKEDVEHINESLEELTPSKHGSFSVNSKISKTKEGFHKGQYVGMDTLVHKGTVQHKDNSKPSKFEVHNHVNRGLNFQTHHSDEEKQAIKQHLVKNKMADKHTDITD